MAIAIGCGMMLTIWNAAPAIVSRMGAKADVAACAFTARTASRLGHELLQQQNDSQQDLPAGSPLQLGQWRQTKP